jgi:hypothetical protein
VVTGVQRPERAESGDRDEHGALAGGGSPCGDQVAQGEDLRAADVLGSAGWPGFDQADQALGEVAGVERLEGQVRGDREQVAAEHLVQGGVELGRPLDRPAPRGCHELLGLPFRPVVGAAEVIDADDGGVDDVGARRLGRGEYGAGALDLVGGKSIGPLRTRARTWYPRSASLTTSAVPTVPAAPVTST